MFRLFYHIKKYKKEGRAGAIHRAQQRVPWQNNLERTSLRSDRGRK